MQQKRSSRGATTASCTLVTVPTHKMAGNRKGMVSEKKAQPCMAGEGKHPWNDRQKPSPRLLHSMRRHQLTESDHGVGNQEQVGLEPTEFLLRKPGK